MSNLILPITEKHWLTHWGLHRLTAILKLTFSMHFREWESVYFDLNLTELLTISLHWFMWWLGAKQTQMNDAYIHHLERNVTQIETGASVVTDCVKFSKIYILLYPIDNKVTSHCPNKYERNGDYWWFTFSLGANGLLTSGLISCKSKAFQPF